MSENIGSIETSRNADNGGNPKFNFRIFTIGRI